MENQNNQQKQLVQKKQNQKKNALFGIVALLIVAVIGGTIAYFSSTASFVNEFETATYKTVTTEVFESPDNWTPGETIPKTIATTNEGSIPVAVRVSYTEGWEDLEENTVATPANAVTINFDNTTEWTKEGNYYYYNYKLNPDETTSSFISGVTLNNTASTVTCTPSQDGKTQTCEATDPALGKKYKLTITTETVQYDKYTEAWNTSLVIGDKPTPAAQPVLFKDDDWSVIAANTTSDKYNVGDTKCVALDGLTTTNDNGCSNGEFKVRIANKTACTTETSTTACGFVVEFVDIIATHNMNPSGEYKGKQYNYGWNVDGYPASAMYQEYFAENATNSLYAKLPNDLQNVIIPTTVVSSHGYTTGETNFTSTDKLYLLSRQEVFGDNSSYDTAASATRKLDYYLEGTTDEAKALRVKQYNGSNTTWWLRSAYSNTIDDFYNVNASGRYYAYSATNTNGIAPAFRIGSN